MTVTTTNPTARQRPKTSAAYLTASALYNAGFRGWPLTVMTALAYRESKWNPTIVNNNPSTKDYSIGLWQLNYFGNLGPERTQEYGYSASQLQSNPQDQANEVFKIAGGNALSNLQPWALTSSPASGVTPVGSTASIGQNTLAPAMPAAMAAVAEVGTFGPAPANQIAQASSWPGASPLGNALTSGGGYIPPTFQGAAAGSYAVSPIACGSKGSGGNGVIFGVLGFQFTYCELKAITGGLAIAAGGLVMVIGLASLIVGSLGGRSKGAASIAPVIIVARASGRGVRAVSSRRSSPAEVEEEAA